MQLLLSTHERRLDNGLTVLVREDHSAPVVAVVTHVRAGYFDEPDHLVGISHVLEHMYFKGTTRRGVGEIARHTKAAGGYLNAGTIYDRTSYYTALPSSSLEEALDIQSDALKHSALDADELRRELHVIIQEAKRKLDNPHAVAQETLFATMFDRHRIRRWRIGTEELLAGFTRDDVLYFYEMHYRAANTILVIAGDVDPGRAFELVERFYGDMPGGSTQSDIGPEEPARREFRYREIDGDIAQSYVHWGWHTPGTLHDDTPVLDVLSLALGQGRASRLYRHVRDAGVVSSISTYNYTPTHVGIFGVSMELEPRDTAAAFDRTAAVIRQVREDGFTTAEIERARNIIEAKLLRRLETAEGQANLLASWQALGDWRLAEQYLTRAMSATHDDVAAAAVKYLDPDACTILLYRPRNAEPFATAAEPLKATLFAGAPRLVAGPAEYEPAQAPARREARRLEAVQVSEDVHFYSVAGGAGRIVIKPRRTAPLVSLALHCRGGLIAEDDAVAGITGLMARTSIKGTRTRTGARLAEEMESLGGSIVPGVGADMIDWAASVPARHFDAGLELLLDAALAPAFREEDAERERKIALSDIEQIRDDMYAYPLRLALAAAFAGHPYGFDLDTLENSLRQLDAGLLETWHEARVRRGTPHVFVVGDVVDPDAVAARIAAQLQGWLDEPDGLDARPAAWPDSPTQRVVQLDRAQTAIAMAFPGPSRNHPDVEALEVMSAAVAGLGGRLFEELRSRRSLAYVVTAAPLARWLGGAFIAYIGTAPEREDEAREAMREELSRLTTEPLPEDELERARRYLVGTWRIRQQTHGRQLADLAAAVLIGEGVAELNRYEDRILAVDGLRVMDAAARWIVPDRIVEGVVRGGRPQE